MAAAFTVSPQASAAPKLSSLFRQYGALAVHVTDLTGWSDDYRVYFSFMHAITMDPFSPGIARISGSDGVDVVDDYQFGRDCKMSKKEWRRFCLEVLLLDAVIPQTMEAVVDVVDRMLVTIVRCVVGCAEFSTEPGAKLMTLVMAMVRFVILVGGVGVLPREYALARFGAAKDFDKGVGVVDVQVRMFAQKAIRRLTSLGRCVRGLVRVAWRSSMWRDPDLVAKLGLEAGKEHCLCDVWRAAIGLECGLAVLMRSVIGPSYEVVGPMEPIYEDHEYDVTSWGGGMSLNPMSGDTQVGYALALLVSAGGRLSSFGGVDRQVKLFVHNLQMGFAHGHRFRSLGGDSKLVSDLLDLLGVSFGVGFDGEGKHGQFRLRGGASWFLGDRDGLHVFGEDEVESVASFLTALDGSRPVVVDEEAAFRESMMASACEVVTNFARARGFDDSVMDMVASVSFEDLVG